MPESLKKWKVAIILVGQGYKSTEGCHDYKTSTGTTYVLWDTLDINNFYFIFFYFSILLFFFFCFFFFLKNDKEAHDNEVT